MVTAPSAELLAARTALLEAVREAFLDLERKNANGTKLASDVFKAFSHDKEKYPTRSLDCPGQVAYAAKPEYKYDVKRRARTTLGRLLRRQYADVVCDYDDPTIDSFCFRVAAEWLDGKESFYTIQGEDIVRAYASEWGTDSCMTGDNGNLVKMYAANPDTVSMVLWSSRGVFKLDSPEECGKTARALRWKDNSGVYLLDRIYPNSGPHIEIYQKHAMEQGWFVRSHDRQPGDYVTFLDKRSPYDSTKQHFVTVNWSCDQEWPYLDSFFYGEFLGGNETVLSNETFDTCEARFNNTDGEYESVRRCSNCGDVVNDGDALWDPCGDAYCCECTTICHECDYAVPISDATEYGHHCYHEECLDEFTTCCDNCGERVSNGEIQEIGNLDLCRTCVEENYTPCDKCNELTLDEDISHVTGGPVCKSCLEERYAECDECGELCEKSDMYANDVNRLCVDCLEASQEEEEREAQIA